jgi:hypothetical protein
MTVLLAGSQPIGMVSQERTEWRFSWRAGLPTSEATANRTFSPTPLQFTMVVQGKDQVYSTTIDSWSTAPGHVEMGVSNMLANNNGCVFVSSSPLFSYDITSP